MMISQVLVDHLGMASAVNIHKDHHLPFYLSKCVEAFLCRNASRIIMIRLRNNAMNQLFSQISVQKIAVKIK